MHDWLAGIFHTIWLAGWPRTPGSPEMADGMVLDAGWPPPPAAAPDPELRTIVGDGYQAATAAVPGAGAPFFAVLGLVPGRWVLKMGERTVVGLGLVVVGELTQIVQSTGTAVAT